MAKTRNEKDSMGVVKVPAGRYWGAQTQRSLQNFPIGTEKMPAEIIRAFAYLKKACAAVNARMLPERMTARKAEIISEVCDEMLCGKLDGEFPLSVWQTGSGTQTNMNVNEVIANRGNEIAGKKLLHPNDDVNMSQSSNDTFPSAMQIACAMALKDNVIPACKGLASTFRSLETGYRGTVKAGRTHLQDAVPISFAQEISGWRGLLEEGMRHMGYALKELRSLAIGGTAVGTGINAPRGFGDAAAREISSLTGIPFISAMNKFAALSGDSASLFAHGAMKDTACSLMKIANDVRWLASGPACGIGEISIPANEPGSSIMPGKVNPTQCEALTMVCARVIANDSAVTFAAGQGSFQLNTYRPLTAYSLLQSARLLGDAVRSFNERCASGIKANAEKMKMHLESSAMLATALTPAIGYDRAAEIVKTAAKEKITLRDACLKLGYLTGAEFDRLTAPGKLI